MTTTRTTGPGAGKRTASDADSTVRRVRDEYSKIASSGMADVEACCGGARPSGSARHGYAQADLEGLPAGADMGLGCGAPLAELALRPGEVVLDLGSGGGIDVFLAARQVGPGGRVLGVDMTSEMIELAKRNAERGSYSNVEFRLGRLESLPVESGTIDAVTSNCVINLVPDKWAVFSEIVRVLRSGGRVVISDLVLSRKLPEKLLAEMHTGDCITTAMLRDQYLELLAQTGLAGITVLRDVDYLAAAGWGSPTDMNDDSRALLERAGVAFEEIRGSVRSITVRAFKN